MDAIESPPKGTVSEVADAYVRLVERHSLSNAYHNERQKRLREAGHEALSKEMDDNNDVSDIETELVDDLAASTSCRME